jgi:hypothetical protein
LWRKWILDRVREENRIPNMISEVVGKDCGLLGSERRSTVTRVPTV